MPTLLIMRHAKSDWDAPFGHDAERPLAERGIRAAGRMGKFITDAGMTPDAAIASPAVRARTTLELAAQAGAWTCPIGVEPGIYGGSPGSILDLIRAQVAETVIIVGHEPTWSTLTGRLIGTARVRFPTAAVACIGFVSPWSATDFGRGELQWFVPPRALG